MAAAGAAALGAAELAGVRRAALVHDVGRVAVSAGVWQKPRPLTPDEWERVRLHAYHSERVLCRSPFLAGLAPVATAHHERLDGSGYHRGVDGRRARPAGAAARGRRRLPRDDRAATAPRGAARRPGQPRSSAAEARAGRLDADAVAAVLEAAGQRLPGWSGRPG